MFNPTDQMLVPLVAIRSTFAPSDPSSSTPTGNTRRKGRRVRPNIVRLIPGLTRLPIGYAPR
jgi:hypothetical protein